MFHKVVHKMGVKGGNQDVNSTLCSANLPATKYCGICSSHFTETIKGVSYVCA